MNDKQHGDRCPYLSVVTYLRNDGYSDDYERRVKAATYCLVAQLNDAKLESELVLVEWNPPADRPLFLNEWRSFPQDGHVSVVGYVVPPKFHTKYRGSEFSGLHIDAPNVGLRRARGQFLLPKASDTFLSRALVGRLATRELVDHAYYRCDRFDVEATFDDSDIVNLRSLLERLELLPGIRHHKLPQPAHWNVRTLHTNASGDFTLMSRRLWNAVRGFPADRTTLHLDLDSLLVHQIAALSVPEICLDGESRVIKPVHSNLHGQRTTQVWRQWQKILDSHLQDTYGHLWAHRFRMLLNYPRRHLRNVPTIIGPSIERNFAWPAYKWAHGWAPRPTQGANWGLANENFDRHQLAKANWEE